jgi:Aminoglycoside-2''-adenylyltransferase
MSSRNSLRLVTLVMEDLEQAGCTTWLCGGWAEELRGICQPRPHRDIDLFYPADSFKRLDPFIQATGNEIPEKRFHHKRAFEIENVMVEILLVERDQHGWFTAYWDMHRCYWPRDAFAESVAGMRVVSEATLELSRSQAPAIPAYAALRFEQGANRELTPVDAPIVFGLGRPDERLFR